MPNTEGVVVANVCVCTQLCLFYAVSVSFGAVAMVGCCEEGLCSNCNCNGEGVFTHFFEGGAPIAITLCEQNKLAYSSWRKIYRYIYIYICWMDGWMDGWLFCINIDLSICKFICGGLVREYDSSEYSALFLISHFHLL